MTEKCPIEHIVTVAVPASAAGEDAAVVAGVAPFAATVTAVHYVPAAAITGAATNNRTFAVVNKGTAGTGTTSVASLTAGNGVNFAAFDAKDVTLSATAANKVVAAGDVLAFTSTKAASGLADPGGAAVIVLSRI